ncbi:MAG: serine/threonine-protein phosphatase [Clostridia bacterium]|nr:serine/threonine-protein phosphatase [Clostridia bacterium]
MTFAKNDCIMIAENNVADLAVIKVLGNRAEQQDSFGYLLPDSECVVVVADGMGGLNSGDIASKSAVNTVLREFKSASPILNPLDFLYETTSTANEEICNLRKDDGSSLGAGTTMVAVLVKDNSINWNSVGDSRAYLWRNGELVQLTKDQNYKTVLDKQIVSGIISAQEYQQEISRGEALVSYLGMDAECLIDRNLSPLKLRSGDKVILMSDGLYRLVSDNEILEILNSKSAVKEIVFEFENKAQQNSLNKKRRDNMTVAVLKIK